MLRLRLVFALIPSLVLSVFLIVRPLATQGAPEAPLEVISDAPVCVRFYPATGETREGPEICATRPGDPPPAVSAGASPGGATRAATESEDTSVVLAAPEAPPAPAVSPDAAPSVDAAA